MPTVSAMFRWLTGWFETLPVALPDLTVHLFPIEELSLNMLAREIEVRVR